MSKIGYKISKGSQLFDLIWWNKYWGSEAFKALDESGIFEEFGVERESFAIQGTRALIEPNSMAHDVFKDSLLKNRNKNGYFEFRKNPKDKKAKEFKAKFNDIVSPFNNKSNSFIYMDAFGWGNTQEGVVNSEMVIVLVETEVKETSTYFEQMEKLSGSEYYHLKAKLIEENEMKKD